MSESEGKTLAPGFLIAVPQLTDPNFKQSVVLLLQQSDDGALGLVINRESPIYLRDLCKDHEINYAGDPAKRVRVGGPVQPEQGLVLYSGDLDDPEGREVLDGLQVSASTTHAPEPVSGLRDPLPLFFRAMPAGHRDSSSKRSTRARGSWRRWIPSSCSTRRPTICGWRRSRRSASTPR